MTGPSAKLAAVQFLTPPAVAKRLGVSAEKVLRWIRAGELRGIDVSERPGVGRPRFRIDSLDLTVFLERRAVTPSPKTCRRRRRDPNVTEYF